MRKGPRDALQLGGLLTFGGLANLELVTFYWKAVPFNVLMWGYRELVLKAKNSTTIFDKFKFTISNSKFHIQDLQNIFQLNHETKSTFWNIKIVYSGVNMKRVSSEQMKLKCEKQTNKNKTGTQNPEF